MAPCHGIHVICQVVPKPFLLALNGSCPSPITSHLSPPIHTLTIFYPAHVHHLSPHICHLMSVISHSPSYIPHPSPHIHLLSIIYHLMSINSHKGVSLTQQAKKLKGERFSSDQQFPGDCQTPRCSSSTWNYIMTPFGPEESWNKIWPI